jgi:cytochrome oxidase Cu insertion factor (SCO1/SenC/PrrC family)
MYTSCPDSCALQTAEMARIQADTASADVRLVSITVDPDRDTPQVLARYAKRFGADQQRWLFLTGKKEAIHRLAEEGLHLPVLNQGKRARGRPGDRARLPDQQAGVTPPLDASGQPLGPASAIAGERAVTASVLHSSRTVLVDRTARIRGYYDGTEKNALEQLRRDVNALLLEE